MILPLVRIKTDMKHFPLILLPLFYLTSSVQIDKTEILCNKWEYVNSHDPYQGGIDYPADPDNKQYLIFKKDGSFKEIDQWNHWRGKWQFNTDETKVGIAISEHNGSSVLRSEQFDYRRNLVKVTNYELVFWIQGRHGPVTYKYKSIK